MIGSLPLTKGAERHVVAKCEILISCLQIQAPRLVISWTLPVLERRQRGWCVYAAEALWQPFSGASCVVFHQVRHPRLCLYCRTLVLTTCPLVIF